MKKIIFMGLLMAVSLLAKAQDGDVKFGIKAGLSFPKLVGSNVDSLSTGGNPSTGKGYFIGIVLNSRMSKYFWLKHEAFYAHSEINMKLNDKGGQAFDSKFSRNNIELFPISPTFHYKGLQLYAGPFVSMLMTASMQRKDDNGALYKDSSIYGEAAASGNYTQKFDAGVAAGIEYEFNCGFNIGARFMRGFVPLIEHSARRDKQWDINNQNLKVSIGYSFGAKK